MVPLQLPALLERQAPGERREQVVIRHRPCSEEVARHSARAVRIGEPAVREHVNDELTVGLEPRAVGRSRRAFLVVLLVGLLYLRGDSRRTTGSSRFSCSARDGTTTTTPSSLGPAQARALADRPLVARYPWARAGRARLERATSFARATRAAARRASVGRGLKGAQLDRRELRPSGPPRKGYGRSPGRPQGSPCTAPGITVYVPSTPRRRARSNPRRELSGTTTGMPGSHGRSAVDGIRLRPCCPRGRTGPGARA